MADKKEWTETGMAAKLAELKGVNAGGAPAAATATATATAAGAAKGGPAWRVAKPFVFGGTQHCIPRTASTRVLRGADSVCTVIAR